MVAVLKWRVCHIVFGKMLYSLELLCTSFRTFPRLHDTNGCSLYLDELKESLATASKYIVFRRCESVNCQVSTTLSHAWHSLVPTHLELVLLIKLQDLSKQPFVHPRMGGHILPNSRGHPNYQAKQCALVIRDIRMFSFQIHHNILHFLFESPIPQSGVPISSPEPPPELLRDPVPPPSSAARHIDSRRLAAPGKRLAMNLNGI